MRKLLTLAVLLAGSASMAKDVPPPPSPRPDIARVRDIGERGIRDRYFTIDAIGYTSGFQWGFAKPVIGRRTWGWIACGIVEGRSRLRSETGPQRFWIMSDATGAITFNEVINSVSTCDGNPRVPLDPILRAYRPYEAGRDDGRYPPRRDDRGGAGIASELERLASLRDRGVITQAEFEAAKRRLLYP